MQQARRPGCTWRVSQTRVSALLCSAALADAVPEYKDSCGRCYEIACAPMHLKDGYGTGLDRSHVCYDSSKSVVVMITDTCELVISTVSAQHRMQQLLPIVSASVTQDWPT